MARWGMKVRLQRGRSLLCFGIAFLLGFPMIASSEESCTEKIAGVTFCQEVRPKIGMQIGKSIRLDNLQVEGLAARNVFLFLEPATEAGLKSDQSPEDFLRQLVGTQRDYLAPAHQSKTISHSEVVISSGWPVIFTRISPPWSLWRETGSAWHYSTALVCETALLIEQKGDEKTSAEELQSIAHHILSMTKTDVDC